MSRGLPKCDCGDFIRWLVMRDGRRIPINMGPSPEQGTVWIDGDGHGVFLDAEDRARAAAAGEELWVLHHQTCRNVERHRVPRSQMTLDLGGDAA